MWSVGTHSWTKKACPTASLSIASLCALLLPMQVNAQEVDGTHLHQLTSPYQSGETEVRVLLPEGLKPDEKLPVLYLLPVEAERKTRWGDSLREVLRHDLHNKHRLICAFPTFSALPWYADHPTDAGIRQESYFIKDVVPLVERTYPVLGGRRGRLLVGFSKSGWGVYSLLLRHPKLFAAAAAWDAPLMTDEPVKYGMGPIFATQENFENYRITSLLRKQSTLLQEEQRLILTGHGNFKPQHDAAHALMESLKIKHVYREGPQREHSWNSGWLPEAVELLTVGKLSP